MKKLFCELSLTGDSSVNNLRGNPTVNLTQQFL